MQKNDRHAEYIDLVMSHMKVIYRYVVTMVPHAADSEDILQEIFKLIWVKFDHYKTGTNFKNWALSIARYKVLSYYRSKQQNKVKFSSQTIDAISDCLEKREEGDGEHIKFLQECIARLTAKDRKLIQQKYNQKITTKQLAAQIGRPVSGLYSTLARIQKLLIDCIQRNLAYRNFD